MRQTKITPQMIFDDVLQKYEELEQGTGWELQPSPYNDGMMFAYSDILESLYQLEEVEDERVHT